MMNSLHPNNKKSKFQKLDRQRVIQATGAKPTGPNEWMGRCPTHDDKDPSCKIWGEPHDAKVHCFAGCDWKAIRDALLARGCAAFDADGLDDTPAREYKKPTPEDDWEFVSPVPSNAPFPLTEFKKGYPPPATHWEYLDNNKQLLFYVFRFNLGDGKKDVVPQTLWSNKKTGALEWRWKAHPVPRPLYHLERLADHPDCPVLVVEGEKSADAAAKLFPGHVAITSSGGSQAAGRTDWTPLAGRDAIIWPDADDSGAKYAHDVARLAHKAGAASVKILPVMEGKTDGWDAADALAEGWTPAQATEYLATAQPWTPPAADTASTGAAAGEDFAAKYMKCHAEEIPKPENIAWLWQPRITLGSVTVIGGNPGVGKSTIALDLAARITTGAGFPDRMPSPKGRVLLLVGEDHHRKIVSRRLDAAGADRHMVEYVEYRHLHDLDKQMGDLESCLKAKAGFKMVIIDPVSLYIGDKIEFHHQNEVAQFYGRLGDLAERFNVAILVVAHLNKNSGQETAIYRISGSSGHVSVARAVFIVTKKRNPDNPDDWRCYFIQAKNSYGPDDIAFRWWHSGDDEFPCIEWDPNPILVSADDLLSGGKEPTAQDDAERWLSDILADGPVESNRIKRMALRDGYSWGTIRRAQKNLGIKPYKKGYQGEWTWEISKDAQTDDACAPLDDFFKDAHDSPKVLKFNEHSPCAPLDDLSTFEHLGQKNPKDAQTNDACAPLMDKTPVDESGPAVEEEF